MRYDILNRLGFDHKCDRRTDEYTEERTESTQLAIARVLDRAKNCTSVINSKKDSTAFYRTV